MTTENKETEFDVRKPLAPEGCFRFPNGVRPMLQFVDETTESRLKGVREQMTFTRAKNTIRRTGWYFTESYTPCGSADASPFSQQAESGLIETVHKETTKMEEIKASIAGVFGA